MAVKAVSALPADLFHLLCAELSDRLDFPTLYSCVVSSKQLANAGAINALYRISHYAPMKSGGGEGLPLAEQELNVQRWSIMWRTITLSAFGKTAYPYCRHLRFLDLRDLDELLEDGKFRGKISAQFFSDELAQLHYVQQIPRKKGRGKLETLDTKKIIFAIGNQITQQAPLLEELNEPTFSNILSSALLEWAPRLANLRYLDFWDGHALADETLQNIIHTNCPNLSSLRIFASRNDDSDHRLATFISGLKENTLVQFENISNCNIGAETCLALNSHGKSLHSLKLCLVDDGILALAFLQGCTALETLALSSPTATADLKATQNDVYLSIIAWLKDCKQLQDVSFENFISAPDLLLPVLLDQGIALKRLQIKANDSGMYAVKDHHDFHQALSQQSGLRHLLLQADAEPGSRDDTETLMNTFCSLRDLRELRLTRISDYFSDEHIILLASHLKDLEDLYVGGYGTSDVVFPRLAELRHLKSITFSGVTTFTVAGILKFIESLEQGVGKQGMVLQVDNADPYTEISPENQDLLRETIAEKLDGRFEYLVYRDLNAPEFDSDESD